MDITQIRYFSRVYETQNYAHAAEQLYISRQALRKSIQNLEREIGQQLFINISNKLQPTEAAKRFYRSSRTALRGFAELEDYVMRSKVEEADSISYGESRGASDVFTKKELETILHIPLDQNPISRKLKLVEGTCQEIRDGVLNGLLDYAAIISTSIDEGLFDFEVAREGRIYLAINREHPLSEHGSVSVSDLEKVPFCTQGPGFDLHDTIALSAEQLGFPLNVVSIQSDLHACLRHVESRLCATYAYSDANRPRFAPNVVYLPFEEPFMRWRYCSIAKKGLGDPYFIRYFAGKEIDAFRVEGYN